MKMWIARDRSGALHLFRKKPTFCYERWWGRDTIYECEIDASQYPEVTFENSPMEVELKLNENENRR